MDMSHPTAAFLDAIRIGRPPVAPLPAEWRSLAERLAAAHTLRQVLGEDSTPAPQTTSGSFDANVARMLATTGYQTCRAVNRVASNDGKPADGTTTARAGTPLPATEG